MFKLNNFRLVRKLMVLGILLSGIFFTLSNSQAKTRDFCCSVCDDPHMECIADCDAAYPNNPTARQACVRNECNPPWYDCLSNNPVCDPGC